MVAAEIIERLKLIDEAQKIIEVQIQTTQEQLNSAKAKELSCKEGVDAATLELKSVKDADVVPLANYTKCTTMVDKISNYHDQARCLRMTLEAQLKNLLSTRTSIREQYDIAVSKLAAAERNVLRFQ